MIDECIPHRVKLVKDDIVITQDEDAYLKKLFDARAPEFESFLINLFLVKCGKLL